MRFPGQRYDAASGLNYNYFRDYDAGSGRYVQSDPIGLKGGVSGFGYVGSNPFIYADPFGLAKMNLFPNDPTRGGAWYSFNLIPDNEDECIIGGHGSPFYIAGLTPVDSSLPLEVNRCAFC